MAPGGAGESRKQTVAPGFAGGDVYKRQGLYFSAEKFTVDDLLAGMNAELRHGTKAGSANVTNDDPTMTAKLAVSNLRVSPSYYSQRVGKSAWERSLAKGVQHRGVRTEFKTIEFALEDLSLIHISLHHSRPCSRRRRMGRAW